VTASAHMVEANGLRFRALVEGPADGDMVLLMHGFPEGSESWARQMHALAHAGFMAVAPDLRGYGMTDAPENLSDYHMDHLVADAKGLVEAFGRTSAHIAGHDWGAIVAWYFAGTHPQMTTTLTVLSVGHPAALAEARRDADQRERSRYIELFVQPGKAEAVLEADDHRRLRAMYALWPNPEAVPERVVDGFVRSLSRPGRLTAGLNYYRANLKTETGWGMRPLGDITPPTQLLWGDQDPALGRLQAETTRDHVKGRFHLQVLEGAGHWLQFERPDEVALALSQVTAI
jgi:pimeloyl-ACP methyl ester carboxylesterase